MTQHFWSSFSCDLPFHYHMVHLCLFTNCSCLWVTVPSEKCSSKFSEHGKVVRAFQFIFVLERTFRFSRKIGNFPWKTILHPLYNVYNIIFLESLWDLRNPNLSSKNLNWVTPSSSCVSHCIFVHSFMF